jgi:hypothetical protein
VWDNKGKIIIDDDDDDDDVDANDNDNDDDDDNDEDELTASMTLIPMRTHWTMARRDSMTMKTMKTLSSLPSEELPKP